MVIVAHFILQKKTIPNSIVMFGIFHPSEKENSKLYSKNWQKLFSQEKTIPNSIVMTNTSSYKREQFQTTYELQQLILDYYNSYNSLTANIYK